MTIMMKRWHSDGPSYFSGHSRFAGPHYAAVRSASYGRQNQQPPTRLPSQSPRWQVALLSLHFVLPTFLVPFSSVPFKQFIVAQYFIPSLLHFFLRFSFTLLPFSLPPSLPSSLSPFLPFSLPSFHYLFFVTDLHSFFFRFPSLPPFLGPSLPPSLSSICVLSPISIHSFCLSLLNSLSVFKKKKLEESFDLERGEEGGRGRQEKEEKGKGKEEERRERGSGRGRGRRGSGRESTCADSMCFYKVRGGALLFFTLSDSISKLCVCRSNLFPRPLCSSHSERKPRWSHGRDSSWRNRQVRLEPAVCSAGAKRGGVPVKCSPFCCENSNAIQFQQPQIDVRRNS